MSYAKWLAGREQSAGGVAIKPSFMPSFLFDFQGSLTEWALWKGRGALFADCGLGKTAMLLVWAENIVRHTNKPVLVLTPLAVSFQIIAEAKKFDIEAVRSIDGSPTGNIVVTNYERLHLFNPDDFGGVVCDESSILKNFDGARKSEITEFMRRVPYRLLDTATAAPNDYIELGTSSEALGDLGYTDMLTRFFKNNQNTVQPMRYTGHGAPRSSQTEVDRTDKWRFKGHAEQHFWRWVSSWARAIRKPSDLGFSDDRFILPSLTERVSIVQANTLPDGHLFAMPAHGLKEQRDERRRTVNERCERLAEIATTDQPVLVWCHLNNEGDMLERLIPGAVQVSGSDKDEAKEEKLMAFVNGQARGLVTKPKIGAWGLNFQHCAHVAEFPSHSFEQYYQGVRRCWRFGQTRPVTVDTVASEGEKDVLENRQRKSVAAVQMFDSLIEHMNHARGLEDLKKFAQKEDVPSWL